MLLSLFDNCTLDTSSGLRKLKEVGLSGGTFFDNLPLLLDCDSINNGGSLINVEGTDDRDLSVVELRDVDVELLSRSDLFNLSVSDQWDVDKVFSCDSILRNINVGDLREIN